MIFFHKLYYNLNYINPNKRKSFSDICLKPKKLCETYKLYNPKINKIFKTQEKKFKPNF